MTGPDRPELLVYPFGIAAYEDTAFAPLPGVDAEIEQVCRMLAAFGGRHVSWPVPITERGGDAVMRRLRHWARADPDRDTLLYWVGHGWSNDDDAALAHHGSPARVGVDGLLPQVLADRIADRQPDGGEAWAFVVVEACRSARFVELVDAHLGRMAHSPRRVLLVGVSGDGATRLGRFTDALRRCLDDTFRTETSIGLFALGRELERALHGSHVAYRKLPDDAVLTRTLPQLATPPIAVDIDNELKRLLTELPEDLRRHFLPKAQGAETGELPWYFEGRHDEQRRIASWLRAAGTGMLIVAGPPGSGKSALLGHVLAQAQPDLIAALARHGLADPAAEPERPPAGAFDTALLLTGLTGEQAVRRIAEDLGLGHPPATADTTDKQIRWLSAALATGGMTATLLFDALDEAQHPLGLARGLLTALAALPRVRVVVGTRRSTHEGPDLPDPPDTDLLDALRTGPDPTVVTVDRDPDALARYVGRRLTALTAAAPGTIDTVAGRIARRAPQFLFARLAVHEIAARPELLTPAGATELQALLDADHRLLFATAVDRLDRRNPAYHPLLHALALGFGRGLPIRDGVWTLVANAIAIANEPDDATITDLLRDASPYLMVDVEAGQSVYRLAHRTFQEHLSTDPPLPALHRRILDALIAAANRQTDGLNPYLTHHLADHAAYAGDDGLHRLAGEPQLLDRLDPESVIATVSATPPERLPPALAGMLAARAQLLDADPRDRRALRQLAMARHTGTVDFSDEPPAVAGSAWNVRWARLTNHPHHVILRGHSAPVTALAVLPGPGGRTVLASAGEDGTVRLWDPDTGQPIGKPLTGDFRGVTALAAVAGRDGRALLAFAGNEGVVRLWDPRSGQPVGGALTERGDRVTAFAVVPEPDGRTVLAAVVDQRTIRLWDSSTGQPVGSPLTGHSAQITAMTALPRPNDRALLAFAGDDRTIRLWDPHTGQFVGTTPDGHRTGITALTALTDRDGRALLALGDWEVQLWDPMTGQPVGEPWAGNILWVTALAVLPTPDGSALLAFSGRDGMIQLWNPTAERPDERTLSGHLGDVRALAALRSSDGHPLVASAGSDGTVRLWDLATMRRLGRPAMILTSRIKAFAVVPGPGGRTVLASAGSGDSVLLWDPRTGQTISRRELTHASAITALAVLPDPGGRTLLASADRDGTIRLWDPIARQRFGGPLTGGSARITALAALPGPEGRTLLASADQDGKVRLWDTDDGRLVGECQSGRPVWITTLTALSLLDGRTLLAAGDEDGGIRLWDTVTGQPSRNSLIGRIGPVLALAALPRPDGSTLLASAGKDGRITLWDPVTGRAVGRPLVGHARAVNALTALPRPDASTLLVSGGLDTTVRVWEPDGFRCIRELPTEVGIQAMAWTGDLLVVAGQGGVFAATLDLVPPPR